MQHPERYSRQIILPEIGSEGQAKLAAARVLVVGAGGLGCPALLYLAGAGVGHIGIVDFDRVDIGNLQRQILFTTPDRGHPKAQAAKARLEALNPDIILTAWTEELTAHSVADLFAAHDLILDGTDSFAAKYLINDAAVKLDKPFIHGAVQGFDGRVGVFNRAGGACYRCLHPRPPAAPVLTCAQGGVIGALPGIVGTVQAMEAIKLIVGHGSFRPLSSRLWTIDARTMHTQTWTVPKRADCPVCTRPPEEIVLRYDPARCALAPVREMSCAQAAGGDVLFIDVREREEWDEGHIEGAVHLPLSALRSDHSVLCIPRTEKPCVVYCRVGVRSASAAQILIRQGMGNIYNLSGGYEAWRAINSPQAAVRTEDLRST